MIVNVGRSVLSKASRLAGLRQFTISSSQRAMFNVQDGEDFQKRVLSSTKMVIVDFHAA